VFWRVGKTREELKTESLKRNRSSDNPTKKAWSSRGCELEYALHDCYKSSPNAMAQIFISYRRHDSAYLAATLSDKLQQHFGPNSVFFDVDNIPLGVDFREYIGNAVGQCDVLLVIIGDQWMGPVDSQGKRRIDDPSDYVRIEIESALKRNIPVIPVLVEEATMPSPADLPPAIVSIAFRNAAEIRAGRDLRQHIEQLIRGLETIIKSTPSEVKAETEEQPGPPEVRAASLEKPSPPKGTATSRGKSIDATQRKTPKKSSDSELAEKPLKTLHKLKSELMEEIQKGLKGCTDSYLYLRGAIPSDKLANAISAYAPRVSRKDVLLLFDNTVFGGAKDGLLLTCDAVYWHNISSKPGKISYTDIQNADFRESTGIFTAAKIAINQDQIDLNMGDKNKLAEALANVIRHLIEYAKRARGQPD